jgi:hypothetical protein
MNGMDDQDPTLYSPRADDVTAASAWSSSPLGDPADRAEYHPYRYNFPPDFPPDPGAAAGGLKSISKATLVAGLVGTIGIGAALGMAVFVYTNSTQARPLTVVPGSTGVPAAIPAAGAPNIGSIPAQAVTPPDNGSAPAQAVTLPDNGGAPAQVVSPPNIGPPPADPGPPAADPGPPAPDPGPPAADPGSPPVAPAGPVVIVNTPALPPIWLPHPHPAPPPPPPPPACHPPHHLVLHVCV